ncbi:MAG: CBS domain-containing protein [Deltaproteobacteria bacterium]|nr:MAG: CBS domain-containing protein [Deltaproteobacteria bacterium]
MEIITSHVNSDFDTIASMLAASKIYPGASIVLPGAKEETVNDFLLKSTIYAFKMKNLSDIDLESVRRVILVDIRNSSRIGIFSEVVRKPDVEVHIYDHHPEEEGDIEADVEVIKPVGSTTTILVEILKERGIEITPDEATVMMLGIYEDTGFLSYASTTVDDYRAASYLLEKGADLSIVRDILSRDISAEQVYLLYDLINSTRVYSIHGVEVVIAEATRDHYIKDVALVIHKLRDIESINVLFAICQLGDRVIVIGRSNRKEVDAGKVMRELGGGGHWYAASASLKGMTTIQVREKILKILSEKVVPRKKAADIMVYPVITVDYRSSVREAHDVLTRYNINAAPVVRGEKLAGIITRQVVEKALFHHLDDVGVKDYMARDFMTVTPDDDLEKVENILIGGNQRLLPVVEGGEVKGIITRMDLVRYLHEMKEIGVIEKDRTGQEYSRRKVLTSLMRERLPARILGLLERAGEVAASMGYRVYAVGGFVRDLLLRHENFDIDLVVEGSGIEFARRFSESEGARFRSHEKFGTAVIVYPDGFKVDVATARVEYYPQPAALPEVEFSSIKHDLYRRDFTINALAICLNPDHFGELIDFFGGQRDLKDGVVRVLHNLSFVEDPTRILRAVRFEKRFGFKIGKNTKSLISNALKLRLLEKVPKPRIFADLELILKEERVVEILEEMGRLKLGPAIHPKIVLDENHLSLVRETREVCVWFDLLYLEERYEKWVCFLLALFDPLGYHEALKLSQEMGLRRVVKEKVKIAKEETQKVIMKFLSTRTISKKMIYDLLSPLPVEVILHVMAKSRSEDIRRYVSMYFTRLAHVRVSVTGSDLIEMGLRPGPVFREIFDRVLEEKLKGRLKTKEEEVDFIRRNFLRKRGAKK